MTFNTPVAIDTPAQYSVALTYHQRVKGRLRVRIDSDLEAGIVSTRGEELLHGHKLSDDDGNILEVLASEEPVSVAQTSCSLLFARACYHIGNRHAEVQIDDGRLVYLKDHVLDEMLTLLGLELSEQNLPFSPESGAYSKGHSHSHAHSHDHEHGDGHHEH